MDINKLSDNLNELFKLGFITLPKVLDRDLVHISKTVEGKDYEIFYRLRYFGFIKWLLIDNENSISIQYNTVQDKVPEVREAINEFIEEQIINKYGEIFLITDVEVAVNDDGSSEIFTIKFLLYSEKNTLELYLFFDYYPLSLSEGLVSKLLLEFSLDEFGYHSQILYEIGCIYDQLSNEIIITSNDLDDGYVYRIKRISYSS